MNKAAPSLLRILTMVVFALSCFGLLLFLWLSFGGPIPLKPQGYRVQVAFPEAATLATEADVRIAGVSVGKVRELEVDKSSSRTIATIELDREFAPLHTDAQAMLRQKTLLGETYVQLTPGHTSRTIPEGGRLANAQVADTVQLDEIFDALDPRTRASFKTWQRELAKGIEGRGRDFNDALGTLPGFAADGSDVLHVLATQDAALKRLVKNTGVTFAALTENEQQLRTLITSSKRVFDATASRNDALAEAIRIFPTFLDESKATLARLDEFSRDTDPLVRDLRPVAQDLRPTLADVRATAPDLERFFRNLDPLIDASKTGLPAARETIEGAEPLLAALGPFLGQLNPMLQYLEMSQSQVSDFFSQGGAAVADTTASPGGGTGHYLRQFGPLGAESAAIYRERLPTNRGETYVGPQHLFGPAATKYLIQPSTDCSNTGGEHAPSQGDPGCWKADPMRFQGRLQGDFPHVEAADYVRSP
ncbi:MAG TPA: MlaD family protein [Solirubrobacteraceae bacterium]|nr:MlaD family protein [Solirubrobacteraceae bacterium]